MRVITPDIHQGQAGEANAQAGQEESPEGLRAAASHLMAAVGAANPGRCRFDFPTREAGNRVFI